LTVLAVENDELGEDSINKNYFEKVEPFPQLKTRASIYSKMAAIS
jgi:hypothetical protein